jgi:ADP-ribose pyrophosphatase
MSDYTRASRKQVMKPRPWKTPSSRPIYQNPWMSLREDVAELPDGRTTIYGVVTFGDCVGVVPFVDDDHVMLVRQYRYVQRENHRWEIPTGGVREGEALEQIVSLLGSQPKILWNIL